MFKPPPSGEGREKCWSDSLGLGVVNFPLKISFRWVNGISLTSINKDTHTARPPLSPMKLWKQSRGQQMNPFVFWHQEESLVTLKALKIIVFRRENNGRGLEGGLEQPHSPLRLWHDFSKLLDTMQICWTPKKTCSFWSSSLSCCNHAGLYKISHLALVNLKKKIQNRFLSHSPKGVSITQPTSRGKVLFCLKMFVFFMVMCTCVHLLACTWTMHTQVPLEARRRSLRGLSYRQVEAAQCGWGSSARAAGAQKGWAISPAPRVNVDF